MMSAPTCGWAWTFWNSSGVSGPGFDEDVVRHGELADVVQQRSRLHGLHLDLGHPELTRDSGGVDLNAADVVFRRAVLRVDRARERFDRREVQLGNLLDVPAFVVEPREQYKVRAQSQIQDHRDQQQAGDGPVWQLVHPRGSSPY